MTARASITAVAIAGTLLLGCETTGNVREDIQAFYNQARNIAIGICGFAPDIAALVGIAAGFPSAHALAIAVCQGAENLPPAAQRRLNRPITVTVNGRKVSGKFVR